MGWLNLFDKVVGPGFSKKFIANTQKQAVLKVESRISKKKKKGQDISFDEIEKKKYESKGIIGEIELENYRFGDMNDFRLQLDQSEEFEKDNPEISNLYSKMWKFYNGAYQKFLRPSPIERLARRKYVVDIPKNIFGDYVNRYSLKITESKEYKDLKTNKEKKEYLEIKVFLFKIIFKKGLLGEKLDDPKYAHYYTELPLELRKIYEDGLNFVGVNEKDKKLILKIREKREAQMKTIRAWIDEFNSNESIKKNPKFKKLMLQTILQHNVHWMDKNENGEWRKKKIKNSKREAIDVDTGIRYGIKSEQDDFPQIDNYTHDVLSKMNELFITLYAEDPVYDTPIPPGRTFREIAIEIYGEELVQMADEGNLREMYYHLLQESKASDYDLDSVVQEKKEYGPEDFKKFSFWNGDGSEKSEREKKLEIQRLTNYVQDTRSKLCLRQASDAKTYLKGGDIYVLCVPSLVKEGDKMVPKKIPEVALRIITKRDEVGKITEETVDEKEIHGNADNQGITPNFISVARMFVTQKNLDGVYRFKNVEDLEVKFADAELLEQVKTKIENLKNGGPDLDARELRFLYEVYRPVRTFTINSNLDGTMEDLRIQRYRILLDNNSVYVNGTTREQVDVLEKLRVTGFAKMFGVEIDKVTFTKDGLKQVHSDITKVVVGNLPLKFDESSFELVRNLQEITGFLYLQSVDPMDRKANFDFSDLGNLKRISGIELTQQDINGILSGKIITFPKGTDPRLKRIFY
jgi:hypothetical protein